MFLVALFKGDIRQRTLEVFVEGRLVTTWTSSGLTSDFETIDLPGRPAQTVELRGVLSRSQWLSIIEVSSLHHDALLTVWSARSPGVGYRGVPSLHGMMRYSRRV